MIVVEGPDGAGKTTLVNRLVDDLDLTIGTRGITDRDRLWTVTVADTQRALADPNPRVIWDRLFFSEYVYSSLAGRANAFIEAGIATSIYEEFLRRRIPVIWCWPGEEAIVANILDPTRHEMDGVKDNVGRVVSGYRELMAHAGELNTVIYDYTSTISYYRLVSWLRACLEGTNG